MCCMPCPVLPTPSRQNWTLANQPDRALGSLTAMDPAPHLPEALSELLTAL